MRPNPLHQSRVRDADVTPMSSRLRHALRRIRRRPVAAAAILATSTGLPAAIAAPPHDDAAAGLPASAASSVAPFSITSQEVRVPDELDLVVEVRDLARWWHRPGVRGLTSLVEERLAASELGGLWRELAEVSGLEGSVLAQRLLAEELVIGLPIDFREGAFWVAAMRIDEGARRELLSRLPLRPLGGGRHELRGHDLVLIDRPPHLFAGPAAAVRRLANWADDAIGHDRRREALPVVEVEVRRGLAMAPMRIGIALEGSSIAVRGEQLERTTASGSTLVLDPALQEVLDELRRRHAAVVASVAGGPSPAGPEWLAVLPELAVPPSLGRCARERRVWTVGETCGDASDRWRAHATPAVAAAFEVTDADEGRRRLAAWADALAAALGRRFESVALPSVEVLRTVDGGTIPLASITRAVLGGHGLADRIRLDWSSASGPSGEWAIVGTGGAYLRDVRDAFEPMMPSSSASRSGRWASPSGPDGGGDRGAEAAWRLVQVGWIDAERVADQLAHWCDRGLALFEADRARRLRPGLRRMLETSSAFREVRWSVEDNASGDRRFEIVLEPRLELPADPAPAP